MQTALVVILVPLISLLSASLLAYLLRPKREDDVMQQAIGDAPHFVRGGYAAMDERVPIEKGIP